MFGGAVMRRKADEADLADYILDCHNGDAKAAIDAMQDEIEHLQHQLRLAVAAIGRAHATVGVQNERLGT